MVASGLIFEFWRLLSPDNSFVYIAVASCKSKVSVGQIRHSRSRNPRTAVHTNRRGGRIRKPPRFGKHGMRQAGTLARERPRPPSLPHKGASRRKHARGARPMVAGCGRALDGDGSSGGGVGGVSLHSSTTPLSLSPLGSWSPRVLVCSFTTLPWFFVVLSFFRRSKCAPDPPKTPSRPPADTPVPTGTTSTTTTTAISAL